MPKNFIDHINILIFASCFLILVLIISKLQTERMELQEELTKYEHLLLCPQKYHIEEHNHIYRCFPVELSSGSGN